MESTYNYLKGLKVESNGAGEYAVVLGPLKNVYTKFKLIECDENGVVTNGNNCKEYSLDFIRNSHYKIIIKASEEANKYYKIIPYINNGVEEIPIQENDPEKGNVVKIPMIQYTIYWSFKPYNSSTKGFFKKKSIITEAELTLTCGNGADVKSGDLSYKINGLYYPLPAFSHALNVVIPGDVQSLEVVAVTDIAASKFKIERRQDSY